MSNVSIDLCFENITINMISLLSYLTLHTFCISFQKNNLQDFEKSGAMYLARRYSYRVVVQGVTGIRQRVKQGQHISKSEWCVMWREIYR